MSGRGQLKTSQHEEASMNTEHRNPRIAGALLIGALSVFSLAGNAIEALPEYTPEGMKLLKQTETRIVYAMEGADLSRYSKVALIECYVAFAKNWERDYNRSASFSRRIDARDMEEIKQSIAGEFRKVFTEELAERGHEVVEYSGADVVVIRPAIINLDVSAPDTASAGFADVIVRSAGSMTLYMELFDSPTSAIFARVIDARADRESFAARANRVTNKAAADRILRDWARELADHLGAAREDTANRAE
jgi:hypothetical protein